MGDEHDSNALGEPGSSGTTGRPDQFEAEPIEVPASNRAGEIKPVEASRVSKDLLDGVPLADDDDRVRTYRFRHDVPHRSLYFGSTELERSPIDGEVDLLQTTLSRGVLYYLYFYFFSAISVHGGSATSSSPRARSLKYATSMCRECGVVHWATKARTAPSSGTASLLRSGSRA